MKIELKNGEGGDHDHHTLASKNNPAIWQLRQKINNYDYEQRFLH